MNAYKFVVFSFLSIPLKSTFCNLRSKLLYNNTTSFTVCEFHLWMVLAKLNVFQAAVETWFVFTGFHLRSDQSGGDGQYKGGEGVMRSMLFRECVTVSLLTERRVLEPRGLKGGRNGKSGENILIRSDGSKLYLGPKTSIQVKPGERMVLKTPGGGGYGSPGTLTDNEMAQGRSKELKSIKPSFGSLEQYKVMQESA